MSPKIAFFVISTQLGGAERSLLDLLQGLEIEKKQIHIFTPSQQGPLVDELQRMGFSFTELKIKDWYLKISRNKLLHFLIMSLPAVFYSISLMIQVKRKLTDGGFTHVHSTGVKFHILLCKLAPQLPSLQFIIHIRDIISNAWIKSILTKAAKNKNVHLIANSKVTAQALLPIESRVIYNGFSINKGVTSQLKENLGLKPHQPLVGIVGALARWKGQREFIEMAHYILRQKKQFSFLIVGSEIYDTVGDKGELDFLKNRVKELGLQQSIHFLPFQKSVEEIYCGLDVLVHSSIQAEPFGRVVVESMIQGCPVTATALGGPQEIITPEENGLLHSPGDIESMGSNVIRLIESQELRKKISKNARLRAQDFSIEKHISSMKSELGL